MEPIFYHFLKSSSVPASEEEVADGFLHALAKKTKPAIGPPPVGQMVGTPYPILHGQPREKFDLGRGQVGRLGSVYPALYVFPHNVVFSVHLKRKSRMMDQSSINCRRCSKVKLGAILILRTQASAWRASQNFHVFREIIIIITVIPSSSTPLSL